MDRSETVRYHWPAWESGFKQLVNMNQNKALKKKATPANEASPGPREEFCSNCRQTLWMLSSLWKRKFFWPSLFLELLLALSLSVAYYFLVKNYSMGVQHNSTNFWVFSSCSISDFHLEQLGDVWKGRLSGLLLSGSLFDFLVKDNSFKIDQYSGIFGLYQSAWLFVLFAVVICALRHSLFINLGIFAGLIYNFTPASGLYFYPWDIPATLFFTLAVLFFERRQMILMAAAVCTGCFFKETVLACAVLALFASHWKWWKRIALFAGMVTVYMAGKRFLLHQLHFEVAALSMANATSVAGLFQPTILMENLKALITPTLNHAIFANAGTVAAVLVLGWRRRFLPYMAVIVVFLGGQFMYGGFGEFRIFMQILPLSLILLSERWQDYTRPGMATQSPPKPAPVWAVRGTFPILIPMAIVLMALSTGIAAWRYQALCESRRPDYQARTIATLKTKAEKGNAQAQFLLAKRYLEGEGVPVNLTESFHWFHKAAEQGHTEGECQLGVRYVQGEGTPKDYEAGIDWFRKAAAQGNADAQYNLGFLFENGLGVKRDLAEAAIWYQRAGEKGHVLAQNELGLICFSFRKDYAEAAQWFRRAAEQGSALAENSLGVLYLQGLGVKQDNNEAFNWFQQSAEHGCAEGQSNYAQFLFAQHNFTAAAEWFRKAADQGHAAAQYYLGVLSEKGLGRPQDLAEAALWYTRSARQGNALAQLSLGKMYRQGQGVKTDNIEAYKWLKLAQLQGLQGAQNEVTTCAAVMSKDELDAAENEVKQFSKQGN